MSFETLSHTPDFELPPNAPGAPADLISLIEECFEGLAKAVVSKMIRRGNYDQVAVVICQENPTKKTHPTATAEDIADYCMQCMQYDVDKTDSPGTYKVTLIGPPGKGRFERSKHVELGENDEMARSKTMMTEGDLISQQSQYIGELHSQSIGVLESLHGMIKPLLQENKEMMKIISDSARRLGEVERDRMRFDLEVRMHNDAMKLEEAKEELKTKRWNESMEVIKETGAVEALMKALLRKLNQRKDGSDPDDDDDDAAETKAPKEPSKKPAEASSEGDGRPGKSGKKSRVEKAKERDRKRGAGVSESTRKAIESGEDMSKEQLEEVFKASGLEKAQDNPNSLLAEILKLSIEENNQWPVIEETLSEEQLEVFRLVLDCDNDKALKSLLRKLYEMKGARRFMKLDAHLNEDQKKYVEKLWTLASG